MRIKLTQKEYYAEILRAGTYGPLLSINNTLRGNIPDGLPKDLCVSNVAATDLMRAGSVKTMIGTGIRRTAMQMIEALGTTVYRVVSLPSGRFDVSSFDMDVLVDDGVVGFYDSGDDLPDWLQERLSILSMLSPEPPTETIEGVGRRISRFVYWVVSPVISNSNNSSNNNVKE